ncbi:universal stress protein [Pseudodesulfovibrio sp. zrk46]|uniref:universal stress protein n=1 Tax=Pseudodesulfovibrio sp. zrk46 TaxID=2725288 RepID=UPI001449BCAB|nr:universal stress protein [Pseudodesulfovibrio sp. zrk46]QJB57218.1 universal stress protein [Pseudodesulfovibrio sp. zrk46]
MTASPSNSILRHMAAEMAPGKGKPSRDEELVVTPKLLLPLAKHSKAGAGLEFVTHFFTNKQAINLTLMHIPPSLAAVWAEETSYESLDQIETQAATADKKGRAVVEHAGRKLHADGFPKDNLEHKIASPQMSKAKDIIREARNGMYDAVVMGRRVQEGLADVMDQSVCREMLEGLSDAISFPLWLCRLPERERKNVLLCVDGSDPSNRIADHVGFILSHEPGHSVTVFHVHDPAKTDPMDAEAVVNQAIEILKEADMPEDRIKRAIRRGTNAARLIREEYDAGNYAAVALGSAGSDRGFWNKLFVGSVARTVFKDLHGAALWVCF